MSRKRVSRHISNASFWTSYLSFAEKFALGFNIFISVRDLKTTSVEECKAFVRRSLSKYRKHMRGPSPVGDVNYSWRYHLPATNEDRLEDILAALSRIEGITITLQQNSIDQALTHGEDFGFDFQSQKEPFDLQKVKKSLKDDNWKQTVAVFSRKWYVIKKDGTTLSMLMMPLLLLFVFAEIRKYFIDNPSLDLTYQVFVLPLLLYVVFVFMGCTFCLILVIERETNMRFGLETRGLKKICYWTGYLLFDIIVVLCITLSIMCIIFLTDVTLYTRDAANFFSLILFTSLSLISYSYVLSFVFERSDKIPTAYPLFLLCFSMVFPMMADSYFRSHFEDVGFLYVFYSLTCPVYMFGRGLDIINPVSFEFRRFIFQEMPFIALALLCQFFIFFMVATIIDDRKNLTRLLAMKPDKQKVFVLATERARPGFTVAPTHTFYPLKYLEDFFVAYEWNDWRSVRLLFPGMDGVTERQDTVRVFMANKSKVQRIKDFNYHSMQGLARRGGSLGFSKHTPFESIYEDLTVRENLRIFGRIRCVVGEKLDAQVQKLTDLTSLHDELDTIAKDLGFEMKSRLTLAVSLIGSVELMMIEDSELKPQAKRFLWNVIRNSLSATGDFTLLLSQSVLESMDLGLRCESLMSGLMSNYEMLSQISGPTLYGARLVTRVKEGANIDMDALMAAEFKNILKIYNERDHRSTEFAYHLPICGFLFEKCFGFMEYKLKQRDLVEDYSIAIYLPECLFVFVRNQYQLP
eukprot:TRINITY_DN1864_c0_g2_i1.p1 TRINITY_DN1864_c0_g2~~TRINITY_DN1864_c0_g2_i1.p1  ORF type:complete len:748 (+),score=112.63 TRINITY_DN1864_c0_g2_i1:622-2865(+)